MWVTAKKKAKTDQGPTRVEISHERKQESRSAAHSIKSPEGRRRMDTSPVTIQRRQVGREIIQAAESLLSPPLSLTSPTSGGLAFFSPSSRGPITSPINTRRAGARTAVRFSCTPPLSPFGDFSTATIVFDAKQRAAVQEKSDRVMKVQRIRDQFEERKRRNSSIQRAEEERGLWNQFWDVLDDVEADRAHREEEEDAEDVGELLSRLSSGLLDEVLNEKCGGESFHLTKCASGALQLMQLKDRFKRYHDEALEEEEELAQLGCAGTSPVVGSGCFEDNDFFRNLLQVRERSVSLSSTPPLLFSI